MKSEASRAEEFKAAWAAFERSSVRACALPTFCFEIGRESWSCTAAAPTSGLLQMRNKHKAATSLPDATASIRAHDMGTGAGSAQRKRGKNRTTGVTLVVLVSSRLSIGVRQAVCDPRGWARGHWGGHFFLGGELAFLILLVSDFYSCRVKILFGITTLARTRSSFD